MMIQDHVTMTPTTSQTSQNGFTLIELMIVVAVIGVLAAIAYPSYQEYVKKTKRTAMMAELVNLGNQIEAQKLSKGSYAKITTTDFSGNYPKNGTALYAVTLNLDANADGNQRDWILTATPIASSAMASDGTLSFNHQGRKCRDSKCGQGDAWKD